MYVDQTGEVVPTDMPVPEVDDTLKNAGEAADSKTVGDILLGELVGPDIVWDKGHGINTNTGEITSNNKSAVTVDFIQSETLRYLDYDIDYPETPGSLSVYAYICIYETNGTYVGYEQKTYGQFATWGQIVRTIKPGYKYKIYLYMDNKGTFSEDEILSMLYIHWKDQPFDEMGLVNGVGSIKNKTEQIDDLEKEVNGGGENVEFYIEKGNINTTTGIDAVSSDADKYGRSIGYYSTNDNLVISAPVGGRCLVYEYSGESAEDFVRVISPSTTDGITYVSSPYTLEVTSGYFYRFTFILNNSYEWQDGQEYFKDFSFVKQSTMVEGLESRVTTLEQASGSDKIFTGKKCVAFGDSITYRNVWQPVVNEALGMTMVNKGIGSTCLGGASDSSAMCSTTRLNGVLAESPDFVTILGGANDLTTNMGIGTEAEFSKTLENKDRDTFMGAYSYIIEYLLGQDPTLSIMILGTTWAHYNGATYSQTKTYTDYSEASKKVAQYYGLPFVDLHGECGFNAFTMGSASANQIYSSDQIHPNTEGGKRIASLVIAKMIEAWKYTI